MFKVCVELNDNRGNFAIDALAETLDGTWFENQCTRVSGVIHNVEPDLEFVTAVLKDDTNVVSYTIKNQ